MKPVPTSPMRSVGLGIRAGSPDEEDLVKPALEEVGRVARRGDGHALAAPRAWPGDLWRQDDLIEREERVVASQGLAVEDLEPRAAANRPSRSAAMRAFSSRTPPRAVSARIAVRHIVDSSADPMSGVPARGTWTETAPAQPRAALESAIGSTGPSGQPERWGIGSWARTSMSNPAAIRPR